MVEDVGYDGKKFIWEVVGDHVIVEVTDYDDIGLWGFGCNFFDEDMKRVGREGSI